MKKNILITGIPESGKSTLLKKLIADTPDKVGFVTNEVLGENGRVGFEIETNSGRKTILAHIDFVTPVKVSKYFVNIQNLESIISEVSDFQNSNLLYVDEIGQMQLSSEKFNEFILKFLNSKNTCVATLSYVYGDEFTNALRKREDVILVELSDENRGEKEKFLQQLLKKIEKAKGYIGEPDKFTKKGEEVIFRSEHGARTLLNQSGRWVCNCDFFKEYDICSHAIATEELLGLQ